MGGAEVRRGKGKWCNSIPVKQEFFTKDESQKYIEVV